MSACRRNKLFARDKRARIVNSRLSTFARAFQIRPILANPADEQVDTGIDKNIRIFESRGEDGWRGVARRLFGAAKKIDRRGRGREGGRDEIEAAIRCIGVLERRQWRGEERRGELVPGSGTRAALERDGNGWWKNNARRRKDFSGWEMGKFSSLPRIIIEMAGKFCWEIIKN